MRFVENKYKIPAIPPGDSRSGPLIRFLSGAPPPPYTTIKRLPFTRCYWFLSRDRHYGSSLCVPKALRRHGKRSAETSSTRWCRWPTAQFMRWSSVEKSRGASHCLQGASFGISAKLRLGWKADGRSRSLPPKAQTSGSGGPVQSKRRIRLEQRHRRWHENGRVLLPRDPGNHDIRPL